MLLLPALHLMEKEISVLKSNHFSSTIEGGGEGIEVIPHCTENSIYAFTEKELRGLSPNSYIHVSMRD
jgi:hypothetical protein